VGDISTTIPTFTAGQPVLGSDLATMAGYLSALSGSMTDWSSSFSIGATTTAPTKGNSTYVARYNRAGKLLLFQFKVTIGSSFSAGSGTYLFALPYAARVMAEQSSSAYVLDSGTANYPAVVTISDSSTSAVSLFLQGSSAALGSAGPGSAWNAGDQARASMLLELA
jgi:hypothetical protein